MNFQEFNNLLETKLKAHTSFELLEYQYLPYSFGSGLLVYRINGFNYRLIFDGRDNELTVERGNAHEKYNGKHGQQIHSQQLLNVDNTIAILLNS